MPRWFTKPTTKRPKAEAADAQAFEVGCRCGQVVSGVRGRRHQAISCEECGEVVFVLPADVYPPLKSMATKTSAGKKTSKKKSAKSIRQPPVTVAASSLAEEPAEPIFAEDEIAPETSVEEVPPPATAVLTPHTSRKKLVTPFRLVMVVTAILVSLTVWWGLHVRALDQAARTARSERKAADAALSAGDLDEAARHYGLACDALQVLGRNDDSARQTCRLAQETKAAANLAMHPLMQIVEEAHTSVSAAQTEGDREYAEAHAFDLYADQWIVMETRLMPAGGDNATSRRVIDYPIMIGSTVVEVEADLPAFSPLPSQSQPQRVLFAAQLSRCRLSKGPQPRLVIEFNPESAFLWTNSETLEKIGLLVGDDEADAETLALLDRQLRLVEKSP